MNAKPSGFTLVELTVVLAIVLVLAAILFPVLSKVRENGRRATCQSNMKQFGLALQQYVSDNDGRYPSVTLWGDKIKPYIKTNNIFLCPDGIKEGSGHASPTIKSDYGLYAVYIYAVSTFPFASSILADKDAHESRLVNTSSIPLVTEGNSLYPAKFVISSKGRVGRWFTHHSGGANYLFVDGHVKWCTPEVINEISSSVLPPRPTTSTP